MQSPLLNQLRVPVLIILFAFICLFVFTKIFGPIPFYVNSVTTNKQDLFSVTGTGDASAVPSTAQVSLGVQATAPTVQEAQQQVNTVANKVTADAKNMGILEKDIKTTNYSSYPTGPIGIQPLALQSDVAVKNPDVMPIRHPSNTQYTVSEDLTINVESADTANKLIDAATNDGANVVGGVNFVLSDAKQMDLENQARTAAIQQAKQKAQNIANAAGIHLGRLVNVQESTSGYPYPIMYGAAKSAAPDQNTQTTINPGQNKVTISVTLSYETF